MHPMYHPTADLPFKHGLQYFGIHQVIHSIHRSLLITLVVHNPVDIFMNTFLLHTSLPGSRLHNPYSPRLIPLQRLVDPFIQYLDSY
jgi:hypothetical protein